MDLPRVPQPLSAGVGTPRPSGSVARVLQATYNLSGLCTQASHTQQVCSRPRFLSLRSLTEGLKGKKILEPLKLQEPSKGNRKHFYIRNVRGLSQELCDRSHFTDEKTGLAPGLTLHRAARGRGPSLAAPAQLQLLLLAWPERPSRAREAWPLGSPARATPAAPPPAGAGKGRELASQPEPDGFCGNPRAAICHLHMRDPLWVPLVFAPETEDPLSQMLAYGIKGGV